MAMKIWEYFSQLKKNRKYAALFLLAIMLWGGAYFLGKKENPKPAPAEIASEIQGKAVIFLNPEKISAAKGSEFSVDAMIDPSGDKITAVELRFVFNKDNLELRSIDTEGSSFPVILSKSEIDNEKGEGFVILGISATEKLATIDSVSKMATLKFSAKGAGSASKIEISKSSKAAALGKTGNVVEKRGLAEVLIGEAGSLALGK